MSTAVYLELIGTPRSVVCHFAPVISLIKKVVEQQWWWTVIAERHGWWAVQYCMVVTFTWRTTVCPFNSEFSICTTVLSHSRHQVCQPRFGLQLSSFLFVYSTVSSGSHKAWKADINLLFNNVVSNPLTHIVFTISSFLTWLALIKSIFPLKSLLTLKKYSLNLGQHAISQARTAILIGILIKWRDLKLSNSLKLSNLREDMSKHETRLDSSGGSEAQYSWSVFLLQVGFSRSKLLKVARLLCTIAAI